MGTFRDGVHKRLIRQPFAISHKFRRLIRQWCETSDACRTVDTWAGRSNPPIALVHPPCRNWPSPRTVPLYKWGSKAMLAVRTVASPNSGPAI